MPSNTNTINSRASSWLPWPSIATDIATLRRLGSCSYADAAECNADIVCLDELPDKVRLYKKLATETSLTSAHCH